MKRTKNQDGNITIILLLVVVGLAVAAYFLSSKETKLKSPESEEVTLIPSEYIGRSIGEVKQILGEPDKSTDKNDMGKSISVYFMNESGSKATYFYSRVGTIEKTEQKSFDESFKDDPWLIEP